MSELVEKWRIAAAEWLDLQNAADLLDDTKHDVFAEIVESMEAKTTAEKERQARLSARWREFRDKWIEAKQEARRSKFRVKYAEMLFDSWRTDNANARAERAKL